MYRMRLWMSAGVVAACLAGFVSSAPTTVDPESVPIWPIEFDATGQQTTPTQLAQIEQAIAAQPPTDVFIIAHGWLNDSDSAMRSYKEHRRFMIEGGAKWGLLKPEMKPLLIGMIWPSLEGDPEGYVRHALTRELTTLSREHLLRRLLNLKDAGDEAEGNLKTVARLLAKEAGGENADDTKEDIKQVLQLLLRHQQRTGAGDEIDVDPAEAAKSLPTVKSALEVFTYWQMKRRAGIVGAEGGSALIRRIQEKCPDARVHLIGHSFGCKVAVASLTDAVKPINTLVLLQGAVSTQLFADHVTGLAVDRAGGHRPVLTGNKVSGPIVATFSELDTKVGTAYPWASRLAHQLGELKLKRSDLGGMTEADFHGIGAHGFDKAGQVRLAGVEPRTAYNFEKGKVYSVDATGFIPGHSDVKNDGVAWLMWEAVRTPAN